MRRTNFLVRKTRQKPSSQHVIRSNSEFFSGLKEFSVRWVHFNCSLICTFLIIIFSSLRSRMPVTTHVSRIPIFLAMPLLRCFSRCLCTFTFSLHSLSTKNKNSAFHQALLCSSLLSADSLTWKFSFKLLFQVDFSFAAINFWIIGRILSRNFRILINKIWSELLWFSYFQPG